MSPKDNKNNDPDYIPTYAKYQNKPKRLTKSQRIRERWFWILSVVLYFYGIYELTLGYDEFILTRGKHQFLTYAFTIVFTPFMIYAVFVIIRKAIKIIKAGKDASDQAKKRK